MKISDMQFIVLASAFLETCFSDKKAEAQANGGNRCERKVHIESRNGKIRVGLKYSAGDITFLDGQEFSHLVDAAKSLLGHLTKPHWLIKINHMEGQPTKVFYG